MGDWTSDAPGVRRKITVADLPPPNDTRSANNGPDVVPRPPVPQLHVPAGFKIEEYAAGFRDPRVLLTAPNGDIFVTESRANQIKVLRDSDGDGKPDLTGDFHRGRPEQTIRHRLLSARSRAAISLRREHRRRDPFPLSQRRPEGARAGRETRRPSLARRSAPRRRPLDARSRFFAGRKERCTSRSARSPTSPTTRPRPIRARIFEFNPDGTGQKVYAWGIRNAVGIAVRPGTNELWMSTNERDGLGDNLVPDYISRVTPGGFYGWPWFYLGNHQDPRHKGEHPELADKVIVPDVLVQAHSASLNLCFYDGNQFPAEYRGDIFAAFHGSWNRSRRTGYKIVRVPLESGKARGEYEDFVTGFVTPEGNVWGRPVGVTVAKDGSLLFSEDGHGTIWRVSVIVRACHPDWSRGRLTSQVVCMADAPFTLSITGVCGFTIGSCSSRNNASAYRNAMFTRRKKRRSSLTSSGAFRDGCFVDVGAAIGYYLILARKLLPA